MKNQPIFHDFASKWSHCWQVKGEHQLKHWLNCDSNPKGSEVMLIEEYQESRIILQYEEGV